MANKLSNMGGRKEGKKQTQKDSGWQRRMKHLKKSERSIQTVDKTEERRILAKWRWIFYCGYGKDALNESKREGGGCRRMEWVFVFI